MKKLKKKILALVGVESSENGFHVMTEISREIESLGTERKSPIQFLNKSHFRFPCIFTCGF